MLCPFATIRLIDTKYLSGAPLTIYNRHNAHTQAGNGSLYGYYSASGRPSSHFWGSKGGTLEQYVDTALRAEADLDGNDATISTEFEGGEEPYTQAQIDLAIRLFDWVLTAHGMARAVATTSKTDASSRGLSWHRLGIDGNFPALPSIYAGRNQRGGGMYYSSAFGKTCPTNPRLDQLHGIIFPAVLGNVVPPIPPDPPSQRLEVDESWGAKTTTWMQRTLVSTDPVWADGVISHQYKDEYNQYIWACQFDKTLKGSALGRAIQERLRAVGIDPGDIDGLIGHDTILGMQHYYATGYYDGKVSTPVSALVRAAQTEINAGSFLGVPVR